MGEDVSSGIRTGITVVIVAALVAVVLNLMVVSQNIMAAGVSQLEGGSDKVLVQEFEKYNQKKVSGTAVKAAISLYQAKDVAIVVRTNACVEGTTDDSAWAYIYGSLLESKSGTKPTKKTDIDSNTYYTLSSGIVTQKSGEAYFTAEYMVDSGIIQICNNTRGITRSGSSQYILESARFRSFLVKNASGTIVGIFFEQITG